MVSENETDDAGHHGHGEDGHTFLTEEAVTALEWDAETFHGFIDSAIATVKTRLAGSGQNVSRVVDLGCGPGVATVNLAISFPRAEVVAADVSEAALTRTARRAHDQDLAARISTQIVDIDHQIDGLEEADLILASMTLHHIDDEVPVLVDLAKAIAPKGWLIILERHHPAAITFADELGRPGLWERLNEARLKRDQDNRADLPGGANSERYPEMLSEAGFNLVHHEILEETIELASNQPATNFTRRQLNRILDELEEYLATADLDAIRYLVARLDATSTADQVGTVTASRKMFLAQPQ